MDTSTVYFLITMGSIICVNGAFFFIMVLFCSVIAAIQLYYSRKMNAAINQAIADTQAMLGDNKTFAKLIKTLRTSTMKTFGAMLTNGGKKVKDWVKKAGGTDEQGGMIENAFDLFAELTGKTGAQKRKIKAVAKTASAIKKQIDKAKADAVPVKTGIELTEEQQKKLLKYQNRILTKEQKAQMEAQTKS